MHSYVDLARALPCPSEEQTKAFAEFVTRDHSWYKLPIHPTSPFVFFLNPNAWMDKIYDQLKKEWAFVDRYPSYRQNFGFWDYSRFSEIDQPIEGGPDTGAEASWEIRPNTSGERFIIPKRLVRSGTRLLSALMWKSKSMEDEDTFQVMFYLPQPYGRHLDVCIRSWIHRVPKFPENMQEAFRVLLSFWQDDMYQREVAETYRAYDELPVGSEGREEWGRAWDAWETTASRQRERMLLEPLIAALERERQRQIDCMVAAMNRFVEVLHSPR